MSSTEVRYLFSFEPFFLQNGAIRISHNFSLAEMLLFIISNLERNSMNFVLNSDIIDFMQKKFEECFMSIK